VIFGGFYALIDKSTFMVAEKIVDTRASLSREKLFEALYEQAFPPVARFVSKMGGTFQDAKDIFHDALVVYYEKTASNESPTVTNSPQAYILGIAKHLWIRKFKSDRGKVMLDGFAEAIEIPADFYPTPDDNRLLNILERTGQRCLDMLRAFYYDKLPMQALAAKLGFSSVRSATVQKYKCLEKVRDTIKQNSILYEDFFE
jgi:DNA-directed RNA polymerase specialized sigma24 family protein